MPLSVVNSVSAVNNIHIGPTAPNNPVDNQSIWFCTDPNALSIKFYGNKQWQNFGGVFL